LYGCGSCIGGSLGSAGAGVGGLIGSFGMEGKAPRRGSVPLRAGAFRDLAADVVNHSPLQAIERHCDREQEVNFMVETG
jgi:hypothetical protein